MKDVRDREDDRGDRDRERDDRRDRDREAGTNGEERKGEAPAPADNGPALISTAVDSPPPAAPEDLDVAE